MNLRRFFIAVVVLVLCNVAFSQTNYAITPTQKFDLIHTDLELVPVWATHQMKGVAELTLKPYFYPQTDLTLDAKSFDIHSVTLNGQTLKYSYDQKKLWIKFDKTILPTESIKIKIAYTANPDSIKSATGKNISGEKGLYFINTDHKRPYVPMHLWTQGETEANSGWFPTLDFPAEKHTQKIKVTYEDSMVSLSNGKLISSNKNGNGTKTDIWEQTLPHSVYLSVLAIGNYKIVKDQWNGKEVSYYMEPQYEQMARPIFGRTPEMIEFFSKKLNYPYPWDKYAQIVVHDFVAGAMENTSAVTFNEFVQKNYRELVDENDDETIAHELFHHWFGDLATCKSWGNLTLNESFANYSEYLWHEYKDGVEEAQEFWVRDFRAYLMQAKSKTEPLVRTNIKNPDDMFDVISYNKGGKILHMLRMYLGDDAFFKGLNLYLTTYQFSTARYTDLQNAMEKVSGRDLTYFFTEWYTKGGNPILNSSYARSADNTSVMLSQKHSFDSSFLYHLPLDIDFYTSKEVIRKRVEFDKSKDSFKFDIPDVQAVVIDATNSLVGVQNASKSATDWIYILKNSKSFIDRYNAVNSLNKNKQSPLVKEAYFQSLFDKNDKIVETIIGKLDADWLKEDPRWNEKLVLIAKTNKTGSTRAKALKALGDNKELGAYKDLVLASLKDSSYLVEESALDIYFKIDSADAIQYALKSTHSNSFGLLAKSFDILAKTNSPAMLPVFDDGIAHARSFKKIAVYIGYGELMASLPDNLFAPRLDSLEKMLESDNDIEKYSAQTALNSLKSKLENRKDMTSKARLKLVSEAIKNMSNEEEEG